MSLGDYSRALNPSSSSPSSPYPGLSGYAVGFLDLSRGRHHSPEPLYLPLDRRTSDSSVSTASFEYPAGQMDFDDGDSQEIRHAPLRRETSIFIGGPDENADEERFSYRSPTTCPRCDQNLYGRTQRQHEAEGCVAVPIPRPSHVDARPTSFSPGSPPLPEYMGRRARDHSHERVAPAHVPGFSKRKLPATAPRSILSASDMRLGHGFIDEGGDVDGLAPSDPVFLPPGLDGLRGFPFDFQHR
jgi:hypothetical protein